MGKNAKKSKKNKAMKANQANQKLAQESVSAVTTTEPKSDALQGPLSQLRRKQLPL